MAWMAHPIPHFIPRNPCFVAIPLQYSLTIEKMPKRIEHRPCSAWGTPGGGYGGVLCGGQQAFEHIMEEVRKEAQSNDQRGHFFGGE